MTKRVILVLVITTIALVWWGWGFEARYMRDLREENPAAYEEILREELAELHATIKAAGPSGSRRDMWRAEIRYEKFLRNHPGHPEITTALAALRSAIAEEEAARAVRREAQELAEKLRQIARGQHCLTGGMHFPFLDYIRAQMREPESLEHIKTTMGYIDDNGHHRLVIAYRARNGFGGMNVGEAVARVENATCALTVERVQ